MHLEPSFGVTHISGLVLIYSLLPGVKTFKVNGCSCNNLLAQLQVFPQSLDHCGEKQIKLLSILNVLTIVVKCSLCLESYIHIPLAKKICSFQYSSSDRNFRSFCRSFIKSCLSRTHCKLRQRKILLLLLCVWGVSMTLFHSWKRFVVENVQNKPLAFLSYMARPQKTDDTIQIHKTLHRDIHTDLLMRALPEVSSHVASN